MSWVFDIFIARSDQIIFDRSLEHYYIHCLMNYFCLLTNTKYRALSYLRGSTCIMSFYASPKVSAVVLSVMIRQSVWGQMWIISRHLSYLTWSVSSLLSCEVLSVVSVLSLLCLCGAVTCVSLCGVICAKWMQMFQTKQQQYQSWGFRR